MVKLNARNDERFSWNELASVKTTVAPNGRDKAGLQSGEVSKKDQKVCDLGAPLATYNDDVVNRGASSFPWTVPWKRISWAEGRVLQD